MTYQVLHYYKIGVKNNLNFTLLKKSKFQATQDSNIVLSKKTSGMSYMDKFL